MNTIADGLLYTHTSNIHEIVFHDVRNATMSVFMDQLKTIIAVTPAGDTMRLLLHVPAIPSIQYMVGKVREIRASGLTMPQARIALIYVPSLQLYLLNMVVRALVRSSTLKLFHKKDEAEARQWLSK